MLIECKFKHSPHMTMNEVHMTMLTKHLGRDLLKVMQRLPMPQLPTFHHHQGVLMARHTTVTGLYSGLHVMLGQPSELHSFLH